MHGARSMWLAWMAMLALLCSSIGCRVRARAPVLVARPFVVVEDPPPPPRVQVILASPGPGRVWVSGYWARQRDRWVWIAGHWQRVDSGFVWVPPRSVRVHGGWRWSPGFYWHAQRRVRIDDPRRFQRR